MEAYDIGSEKLNIVLEDRAEYESLETLNKHFTENQSKGDNYIKIEPTEDGYLVEFLPLSKTGQDFLMEYVKDDNFGKPEITQNFIESLRAHDSFDRILEILNHTIALKEDWALHSYARAYFQQIVDKIYASNSKRAKQEKKVKRYSKTLMACDRFLLGYYAKLSQKLYAAVEVFKNTEGINEIQHLIDEKKSVINNNTKSFLISPLLFPFDQWKNLVIHEFTILPDLERFESYKKMFNSLLDELEYRIGSSQIPLLSSISKIKNEEFLDRQYIYHTYWGSHFFKYPISQYTEYIATISLDKIRKANRKSLLSKLKMQEKERIELLKTQENSKITLLKNYKYVVRGFAYLFSKLNPEMEGRIIKKLAQRVVSEIFHTQIKNEKNAIPEDFKFSNQLLLEYTLLLEKNSYIKYNPKVSIPKIIAQNCSLKMKGMTQSNLYHILKKMSYNPDNIQKIKLSFQGLTSEIALLNEMKN